MSEKPIVKKCVTLAEYDAIYGAARRSLMAAIATPILDENPELLEKQKQLILTLEEVEKEYTKQCREYAYKMVAIQMEGSLGRDGLDKIKGILSETMKKPITETPKKDEQ
jgi:hypothetical protein